VKVATFTVHASAEQSRRWKLAAEAEGHRSASTWLAAAADAYLKVRARAGLPVPLGWHRARLAVRLEGGDLVTVRGHASPPFFAFRGTAAGHNPISTHYSLVRHPGGEVVATLRTFRQVRMLAAELVAVLIRGDRLPSPGAVVERHEREAK